MLRTFRCDWCEGRFKADPDHRPLARFCSKLCRQSAWRLHQRGIELRQAQVPKVMAYADPPYPGTARKYYRDQPSFRGEVNHKKLIASLVDGYDGWALSTSAKALRRILPMCPEGVRVGAWCKPNTVRSNTYGMHNAWEPLIVMPGRRLRPAFADWIETPPARRGGTLPGRKPIAFCSWLFRCMGLLPGDELVDLYPGSGIVGRAFREWSRRGAAAATTR